VNRRPFGQYFSVSFLAFVKFGVDGEAGLDFKIQGSLVLKIDGDGVILARGEQFDFLCGFASGQREFDKASAGKISLVENKLAWGEVGASLRSPLGGTQSGRTASIRITV